MNRTARWLIGISIVPVLGLAGVWIANYKPSPQYKWQLMDGTENCNDDDKDATFGSDRPADDKCDFGNLNKIAVCWNGTTYKNASNPERSEKLQWCSYKAKESCTGGSATARGFRWICKQQS